MNFTVPLDLSVLLTTKGMFPGAPDPYVGKVRDVYPGDKETILLFATDRISALDKRLREGVPNKGRTLNILSEDFFSRTLDVIPNHLITCEVDELPDPWVDLIAPHRAKLEGRFMLCRRTTRLNYEAVVRGFLSGSLWKEYIAVGGKNRDVCVWGIPLPGGMRENQQLPEDIFTPTIKAESGHDDPVSFEQLMRGVGVETAVQIRDTSLKLYADSRCRMAAHGILKADEKYEFGWDYDDKLTLIDEANTPDSARFWRVTNYWERVLGGQAPESYDKDPVRRWLRQFGEGEVPSMPEGLILEISGRYMAILEIVTGVDLTEAAAA